MPDDMDEVKARRRRMRSIEVLNQQVASLHTAVTEMRTKLDEFVLLAATIAGSVKLGSRALTVVAGVVTVGSVCVGLLLLGHPGAALKFLSGIIGKLVGN